MKARPVEFPFPMRGWDTAVAKRRQPPQTSPDLVNVLPHDEDGRARGGQRPGTAKHNPYIINGGPAASEMGETPGILGGAGADNDGQGEPVQLLIQALGTEPGEGPGETAEEEEEEE